VDDTVAVSAPFVGREAELRLLAQRLARLRRGEGGIVSLVGEAGIGKSRLVAEVLGGAEARDVLLLVGRALSVGQSLGFHPFTDLLRGWAGIAGGTPDAEAVGRLDEAVRAVCAAEADEIVPFLAVLMGLRVDGVHAARLVGIDGEALEHLTFKSMRTLLVRFAASRPVVVFLEDLHWADRSSVRLLEMLLRLVTECPILFVHAFRPAYAETGQRVLDLAQTQYPLQHRVIRLQPLDSTASAALVRHLVGAEAALPSALDRLTARAEGNPLFVEEMIRSLRERGVLDRRDGHILVRDDADAALPGSVRDVIAARLDQLDPETREVLQTAAVIGRTVFGRLLAAVRPGEGGLDRPLRELTERGLLVERRTRRTGARVVRTLVAETEYVFQHALVQESAYDAIAAPARRELHGRVATAIEAIFADRLPDFYGMLAYHSVRASDLAKAEAYLFKAGEQAARAAAASEALRCFEQAARIYVELHGGGADPGKLAQLERNIGQALLNTGRLAESLPHFDRALAHLGDPIPASGVGAAVQGVGDALAVFGRLVLPAGFFRSPQGQTRYRDNLLVRYPRIKAQSTSDPRRLAADYCRAVRWLNQTDPAAVPDQVIGLYGGFAAMFAYSGISFRIGRRYLAVADRLRRPGHAKDRFDHDCLVCICNYLEGNWDDDAGTVPDDVVTAALRYGGPWEVNTYLGLDADRRVRRGDFAGARERIAQLADLADTYGFAFARTNQMAETMLLLLEERQLDGALDAANLYHAEVHDDLFRVLALGSRAKAQVLRGQVDEGAATVRAAAGVVDRAAIIPPWHLSAYAVGRLHHALAVLETAPAGERSAHAAAARRAVTAAQRVAARCAVQRGETHRLVARFHWLRGDAHRAARWLRSAIETCVRLGARPELARAHLDASVWGLALGDGLDPAAHRARAEALFAAIGLSAETTVSAGARRAA